jgi:hypothetical protein
MTLVQSKSTPRRLARAIMHRTRGRTNGPITRLMSPSDLGEILKPFVFSTFSTMRARPSTIPCILTSGIATLTYAVEGAVNYIDPDDTRGTLEAGGVERMQGWTRHMARRRARQSRPDARLPALDRLAAGTRIGLDDKHLSALWRCAE